MRAHGPSFRLAIVTVLVAAAWAPAIAISDVPGLSEVPDVAPSAEATHKCPVEILPVEILPDHDRGCDPCHDADCDRLGVRPMRLCISVTGTVDEIEDEDVYPPRPPRRPSCGGHGNDGSDGGGSDPGDGSDGTKVTVAMVGEIGWCDDHAGTWDVDMQNRFETVVEPAFSGTDAEPVLKWMGCLFSTESWTYDHSVDDAAHCHDPTCSNPHPYAFNKVSADPNHKIGNTGSTKADDGYLHAVPHLDGEDMSDALGGHRGVEAYAWHFRKHYDVPNADLVQLVHDERFHVNDGDGDTVLGLAPQRGEISGFWWGQDEYTSSHELGHNLDANHCDAKVTDHRGTVMVDPKKCSYEEEPFNVDNEFSSANRGNIYDYVTATYD